MQGSGSQLQCITATPIGLLRYYMLDGDENHWLCWSAEDMKICHSSKFLGDDTSATGSGTENLRSRDRRFWELGKMFQDRSRSRKFWELR